MDAFRSRYKELARTLHPDKARCDAAEDAFKIVTEAFRQVTQGGVDRNAGVADAGGVRSGRKPFWSVDASATASAAPAAPKWSAAPEDASTRSRWGGGGVSGAPTASKPSKTQPRASTRWDRWDPGVDGFAVVEEEEEEEIDEHAKTAQEEDAAWFSTWGASIYGDDERTGTGPKPARWSEGGGFGGGGGGGGVGGGGRRGSRGQRSSGGSFDKWSAPVVEPAARRRATRGSIGIGIGSRRKFPREDHWRNDRSESDDDEDFERDLVDGDLDGFVVADGAPHADGDLEDEPRVDANVLAPGVATARDWLTGGGHLGGGRYWSDPPATGGGRGGGWGRVADTTVTTVKTSRARPIESPHVAIVDEEDDGDDGGEDLERCPGDGAGPEKCDKGRAAEGKGKGKTRSYPWRRRRRKGKGKKVVVGDGQENAGANRDPSMNAAAVTAARKRPAALDEPRIPHTRLPKKAFTQATLAFG